MNHLILAALIAAAPPAHACTSSDSWGGPDKNKHAAVGAVTGFVVAGVTDNFWYGVGAAALLGAAKEYSDSRNPATHTCSMQDFLVTASAGAAGAGFNRIVITYGNRTVRVSYSVPLP